MSKCTLNVSDFTKDAFNRFIEDGDGSGEGFRIEILSPALKSSKVRTCDGQKKFGDTLTKLRKILQVHC